MPNIESGFSEEVYAPPDEEAFTDDQRQMMNLLYDTNDLANRISDIKNRIELRKMLAEYEANHKSGADGRQNTLETNEQPVENVPSRGQLEENPFLQQQEEKRTYFKVSSLETPLKNLFAYFGIFHFQEREEELEDAEKMREILEEATELGDELNELPHQSTSFREVAKAEHIPEVDQYNPEPNFFKSNKHHFQRMRDYEDPNEFPEIVLMGRDQLASFRDDKAGDGGLYTEGGLVYVPSGQKTENLFHSLMGFTRHERLDVKKPGPPPQIPPSSQSPHEPPIENQPGNLEQLPAHMKADDSYKAKKIIHGEEDHAKYSVDTEYAHVILKNPLDNWKDGARIVQALGEMLNLQNYFTHPRVDRHEVSFRVEPNPEKKTAADVAKSINDSRFKNNLSRRLGVLVSRAGVGDKVKDYEISALYPDKIERAEDGPDMTRVMIYMFAGAGFAAIVVAVVTLSLIRRHDKKKGKLDGLQTGNSATETCSKDYQELCRARMAGKNNETTTGRIASLTKENDRPPSSRSSTSSWSEEPALSNMDISTGHMVLVRFSE